MLIFAAVTSPSVVGSYAWMVIALTGVQAVFDAAVRQVAVGAIRDHAGIRFLRRYSVVFATSGPVLLLLALLAVSASATNPHHVFWPLAPIVLTPTCIAVATTALARMQADGRWRAIALIQTVAVTTSLAITLPLVITTQSALGPALQALIVEALNASMLIIVARRVIVSPAEVGEGVSPRREFFAAAWYSGLGWAQSQADRMLVGALGGQRVLGLYSFSWSLSRNVGDALSYASVNVLRPQLLRGDEIDDERAHQVFHTSLKKVCLLLAAVTVATFLGATWILPLILDERWEPVFTAVPVMSLSSFALVTAWSLTPMLVRAGRLRTALVAKVIGVLLAIPVGIVAAFDLTAAAWVALAREIIVTACLAFAARRTVHARAYLAPASATLGFGLLIAAYQYIS
ncbi:oligosaccharide flippase family protein [Microbacterium sp. cf332]|uniref:oligosaccharide flippase family protein n=1 Tax=Microbacterium sp. cf332 TaxID=1761804 RepID=UPI0015A28ADE|nr:oligosaccharide flippase family protein [Microbacterium sp. cf332]